ncbi:hypothetical protein L7F22_050023 [Adiantum nelumboides]|nr:hypothetical protein [Adiantum nelumboides]
MVGRPGVNFGSEMLLLNAPAYDNLTPKGKPKDYKEGGEAVKFDTFHGIHDKLKALLFLQQFDAAFAGGNSTESSKLRKAATFLKTNALQWWTTSLNQCVVPSAWVQFKQIFAPAWITNTFEVDVMTAWNQLSAINCESLEYNAKFWDALLTVSSFKKVPLAEQIEKYCCGLPKGIKKYCCNRPVLLKKGREAGDPYKRKGFLPPEKQYLITRNVPCLRRAFSIEEEYEAAGGEVLLENEDNDGWLATHSKPSDLKTEESAPSLTEYGYASNKATVANDDAKDDDDSDVPDMSDYIENDDATLEPSYVMAQEPNEDNILRTRTYDVSITTDCHYQQNLFWRMSAKIMLTKRSL